MVRPPMNQLGKPYALLATARVANVPSVASNVWVGVVLGFAHGTTAVDDPVVAKALWLALAGILLYVGGNFFNDWFDRRWDAKNRPERALPRGLFPPRLYAVAAVTLLFGGTAVAATVDPRSGWVAAGIVFWITVYTLTHKRTAWAVVPMGLCRGLLPVMGSMAFFPYIDFIWPVAAALLCYIAGLSLSARYEALREPPRWVGVAARTLLLATAVLVAWENRQLYIGRWLGVAAALPYLGWTSVSLRIWNQPVPVLVSRLLAGIPLVDWMVTLPLAIILFQSGGADARGMAIACLAVPPVAFLAALLLQRVAPAT